MPIVRSLPPYRSRPSPVVDTRIRAKPRISASARLGAALLTMALLLVASPVAALDSDGDGLRDGFEKRYGVTSPFVRDSDHDGVIDSAEDDDGDRLSNLGEQRFGLHPGRKDTDRDGRLDGGEDADHDGRSNALEQDQRRVPANLKPSLSKAAGDRQPDRKGCQVDHGRSKVIKCVFGNPSSSTTLTLVGDSNLTQYLTPLKRLAKARGWRVELMAKSSCPSFLGLHGERQWEIDGGVSCRRWRLAVIDELKAHPPDYLIYANVPYTLRTIKGKPIPEYKRPALWRDAVKRTLDRLPNQTRVLVLGMLPATKRNPVDCLKTSRRDMSRCQTRRQPAYKRKLDKALKAGALAAGQQYGTLHDKICSYDPCPLVQGDVLVWRDGIHITETFAKRLRPSLDALVERKLVQAR